MHVGIEVKRLMNAIKAFPDSSTLRSNVDVMDASHQVFFQGKGAPFFGDGDGVLVTNRRPILEAGAIRTFHASSADDTHTEEVR